MPAQAKYAEVLRLLNEALQEEGGPSCSARQKTVEEVARFLKGGRPRLRLLPRRHAAGRQAPRAGGFPARQPARVIAATQRLWHGGGQSPTMRLVILTWTPRLPGELPSRRPGGRARPGAAARCIRVSRRSRSGRAVPPDQTCPPHLARHPAVLKALRAIERKDRQRGQGGGGDQRRSC